MKRDSLARWAGVIVTLSVVAGIVPLVVELRQNQLLIRAQARHGLAMAVVLPRTLSRCRSAPPDHNLSACSSPSRGDPNAPVAASRRPHARRDRHDRIRMVRPGLTRVARPRCTGSRGVAL